MAKPSSQSIHQLTPPPTTSYQRQPNYSTPPTATTYAQSSYTPPPPTTASYQHPNPTPTTNTTTPKLRRPPPPPPPKPKALTKGPQYAQALYEFEAQQDGDLPLHEGDRIEIIEKTEDAVDWWKGRIGNQVGIFPGKNKGAGTRCISNTFEFWPRELRTIDLIGISMCIIDGHMF